MRKIDGIASAAFTGNYPFASGNTTVTVEEGRTCLFLFGNKIAERNSEGLFVTTAGWDTHTTRSRLNSIPNVRVHRNKQLYLNGEVWEGEWKKVQ